jgi:penicillin-binding protein 1A
MKLSLQTLRQFIKDYPRLLSLSITTTKADNQTDIHGKKWVRIVGVLAFLLGAFGIGGGWFLFEMYQTLPTMDQLENIEPPLSTKVLDRFGNTIYEFSIEKRSWVPLAKIPVNLQNAVIAIEDRKFYDHWGIDLKRIIGAGLIDVLRAHYAQGASTLTQQLARNVYLSSEPSMTRKIREAMTAVQIESYYTKPQILELYLNQVYFGAGVFGVEAASHCYFNKPVTDLNLNECATLAGIIQRPEAYRPDKPGNLKRMVTRRNAVLHAMRSMHLIDRKTSRALAKTAIPCDSIGYVSQHAPYFVELVRQYIERKYGDDKLYNGGLVIHTTLDAQAQDSSEKGMTAQLKVLQKKMNYYFLDRSRLATRLKIPRDTFLAHFDSLRIVYKKDFDAAAASSVNLRIVQTAIVAIDVKTGGILTLIGGRNFAESKFNRATQAVRQPGSAFKPFVFAAAIDKGYTASSMVEDEPISLMTPEGPWNPVNYDGKYLGLVPLRYALEHSLNMVAIHLLLDVSADTVISYARRLGLTQNMSAVPSLAIGSCEVIPLEMAAAYAAFANRGIRAEPYMIEKVTDKNGAVLERHTHQESVALSPQTSFLLTDMLTGVVRRGTAAAIPGLGFTRPSAGKTGTSNDYSDAWFVGYTPQIACCVWVGTDERKSLGYGLTGAEAAVPMYVKAMKALHRNFPIAYFARPDGIAYIPMCKLSHKRAVPACPETYMDYCLSDKLPEACDIHGNGAENNYELPKQSSGK